MSNERFKFRAWDKYSKKMISPASGDFIRWHAMSNWKECLEVMQWTGLNDANGSEIYEGDICQYRDDAHVARIGVVTYCDISCAFMIECVGGDDEGNQDIQCHAYYTIAVIGNIHENAAELLK